MYLKSLEEYKICKKRGHEASDTRLANPGPSWIICKWCGMPYRYIETLEELEKVEDFKQSIRSDDD